ncbi:LacI family DNA-binding transcriptional regulator [Parafilimonas sp.]|uniref:LacI family DNA-binding transcriptional regulator n=1 Tax=Parafilimonas sp. TaxID=1969739 RepID=UPI0039E2FF73
MKAEKEITIYDIAKQLNVSPATVSRALNDSPTISIATRKRINALAEKLGYRHNTFASSLRLQKTHTIGVILHELNSYFITSVLAGIEKITTEARYNLIIVHSAENPDLEAANARNLFHKRVDGVIASLSFDTEDLSHFKQFQNKNIPVVFFDRVFENSDGAKVIINNYQAGYDATAHLIQQGCKRIAHITSSLKRNVYAERMRGYKQALQDNHLKFNEKLLIIDGFKEEDATRSATRILSMKNLPDGIFITNDFCAAVVMQALKDAGIRIPQDIAMVGFNNDSIGKVISPKLTTINYPGFEMGQVAARTLINHLKGTWDVNLTNTVIIKSELIVRESSLKKGEK